MTPFIILSVAFTLGFGALFGVVELRDRLWDRRFRRETGWRK